MACDNAARALGRRTRVAVKGVEQLQLTVLSLLVLLVHKYKY